MTEEGEEGGIVHERAGVKRRHGGLLFVCLGNFFDLVVSKREEGKEMEEGINRRGKIGLLVILGWGFVCHLESFKWEKSNLSN